MELGLEKVTEFLIFAEKIPSYRLPKGLIMLLILWPFCSLGKIGHFPHLIGTRGASATHRRRGRRRDKC